ncbi:Bug family tripartite tricarboxylate transporter substrate binding protein [Comamonas suwonensis]|uniref:Bug family tripartite tricarboxylate transporter substrate binding protein n=1 Tax=Comamonas suwonensis TaxID=2606214 RepID=UPI00145EACEA|nr:tripartite tricarboxylate transporter substrate binding protein [Comamonas suwonensis]MBI1624034.1 tripartite tricarboxylate transporter substrate binding protein [Comamonas suwonensis]
MSSKTIINRLRRLSLAAVPALLCGAFAAPAMASDKWPERPIRLVVNFAPGGAADVMGRAISPTMSQVLGQSVVVDNKPGANGNIGIGETVRAPKDGYTLLLSSGGGISINPMIYSKLPFNPEKDLIPVAAVARVHVFLETNPSLPVSNVQDFIKHLQANPGKLSYGSPGPGSSPHLAGEMFKRAAKVDASHIPYKGAGPALTDVLSGQLQYWFDPGPGLKQVEAGKLKLLAIGSPQRSPLYPKVPTLAESGLPGFDADTLFGIYAPAGTPAPVVEAVRASVLKALEQKNVIEVLQGLGSTPESNMSRQAFVDHHAKERVRFAPLIKAIGLKVD